VSELYTHRIEIYTSTLAISGAYDLPIYRRVSDAINGEQRRYIPLRDATIAPLERAQQAQRVPLLLADRSEALLVATLAEAAPPPPTTTVRARRRNCLRSRPSLRIPISARSSIPRWEKTCAARR